MIRIAATAFTRTEREAAVDWRRRRATSTFRGTRSRPVGEPNCRAGRGVRIVHHQWLCDVKRWWDTAGNLYYLLVSEMTC